MLIKYFFILFILFQFPFLQENEFIIKWNKEKKLNWHDFQGNPVKNTPQGASSSIFIDYKTVVHSYERYILEINAFFDKKKSWVWKEKATDTLLSHEQGHFDISEIHVRKLRKVIFNEHCRENELSSRVKRVIEIYGDSLYRMQNEYDKETHHSRNWAKQVEWNERIKNELKRLAKYSDPYVTVYLKVD